MTERLRSDFWVSAYLRRCGVEGMPAMLRRRGAAEAGAIFVKLDRLDGTATLYGPASQSAFDDRAIARLFVRLHGAEALPVSDVEARLVREIRFDPDMWIVEVDERGGRHLLDVEV